VLRQRKGLAVTHVSMELARHPQAKERSGDSTYTRFLQESRRQLSYLAAALFADNPELFVDYVGWAKVALTKEAGASADRGFNLRCLCDALRFELPLESAEVAISFVSDAIERLPSLPEELPSFIEPGHLHAPLARQFIQSLIQGDRQAASRLVLDAVEDGLSVPEIYLNVLQPTLYEIGRLWQTKRIHVAREHFCTAAIKSIMSQLHRPVAANGEKTGPIIVTTCVAGDQHDIGIQMVADFFEMAGWESYYLGANTPTDSVVNELIERRADVLGISVTITSYIPALAGLILAVRRTPECKEVKILVGGYPFRLDPDLWSAVGADGEALDAEGAIQKAESWFDARGSSPSLPQAD
jgi:methanogenic corrinoid protein MtbC1